MAKADDDAERFDDAVENLGRKIEELQVAKLRVRWVLTAVFRSLFIKFYYLFRKILPLVRYNTNYFFHNLRLKNKFFFDSVIGPSLLAVMFFMMGVEAVISTTTAIRKSMEKMIKGQFGGEEVSR